MIKKTIRYRDYNGIEQTYDAHFHVKESTLGLVEMSEQVREGERDVTGGFVARIQRVGNGGSGKEITDVFEELIKMSYGVKSANGQSFIQTDEVFEEFRHHAAYDALLVELLSDPDAAIALFKGAMPVNTDRDKPNVSVSPAPVTPMYPQGARQPDPQPTQAPNVSQDVRDQHPSNWGNHGDPNRRPEQFDR